MPFPSTRALESQVFWIWKYVSSSISVFEIGIHVIGFLLDLKKRKFVGKNLQCNWKLLNYHRILDTILTLTFVIRQCIRIHDYIFWNHSVHLCNSAWSHITGISFTISTSKLQGRWFWMKNLLSLYPTDLLLTRDVSGVSQQVTLNAAQLVTLFGTVVALVRYKKVVVRSPLVMLWWSFTLSLFSPDRWSLLRRFKKMFAAVTDLHSSF